LRRELTLIELTVIVLLRRGDPFEQLAPAYEQAEQRASHRVDHHPCLMGEKRNQKGALQEAQREVSL
jgi:hypothetical protein